MKKNILMIICDQLSAKALKVYGNDYSKTPNIDDLVSQGVAFDRVYSTCPLCQPSRASFWTSLYPHETGVLSNLADQGFEEIDKDHISMGQALNKDYNCYHFGKDHSYGALRGFTIAQEVQIDLELDDLAKDLSTDYETFFDEDTVRKVKNFFSAYGKKERITKKNIEIFGEKPNSEIKEYDYKKPFFLAVDLQNPHNICSYIGQHENVCPSFLDEEDLPPLPENFKTPDMESRSAFIQYLCCAHRRLSQTSKWQEKDFRYYLYAYYYYLNIVDKQVGTIIQSLKETGQYDDTLIIFFADHGEGMAGHRMVTKYGSFYEESNRVPLIIIGNTKNNEELESVSEEVFSLIDIYPSLVDYTGRINNDNKFYEEIKDKLSGESIFEAADKGRAGRGYALAEWYDEFNGYRIPGRMYVDKEYKYIIYLDKENIGKHEELYSMTNDKLEMNNLSKNEEYQDILKRYRKKLKAHIERTNDNFYQLEADYEDIYRKHELGYCNHTGPNAVIDYQLYRKNTNRT